MKMHFIWFKLLATHRVFPKQIKKEFLHTMDKLLYSIHFVVLQEGSSYGCPFACRSWYDFQARRATATSSTTTCSSSRTISHDAPAVSRTWATSSNTKYTSVAWATSACQAVVADYSCKEQAKKGTSEMIILTQALLFERKTQTKWFRLCNTHQLGSDGRFPLVCCMIAGRFP